MNRRRTMLGLATLAALVVPTRDASAQFQTVYQKIDDVVNELRQGNKTAAEMKDSLVRLTAQLQDGYFKDQVADLAREVGGVVQLTGLTLLDFTRQRLIEDLDRLKSRALGAPEPERVPVLATFQSPRIDLKDTARSTLTLVGWNLDVALAHPDRYKIQVTNDRDGVRDVDAKYVTLQGQYALTIDVGPNGLPFKDYDRKLSILGYRAPFELAVVNSQPSPVEKIVAVSGSLDTTNQDREGGIAILMLYDGAKLVWSHRFPEKPTWGDWSSQPFAFEGLSIDPPADPRWVIRLTQEGAEERNILWRFNANANLRTNLGRTIAFAQNGLSLRCGDGEPATVDVGVSLLR